MPNRPNAQSRPAWVVPVAVVAIAGALIVAILTLSDSSDSPGTTTDRSANGSGESAMDGTDQAAGVADDSGIDLSTVERRDPDDPKAIGAVDAPVVMVMFSDYQCPYCALWNQDTLPAMMQHVDAGDLRIEFHDINVFGPESERAARAAQAAAEQGEYLQYHNALFADGKHRSAGELREDSLVDLAGELGLDTDRFTAELSSPRTDAAYDASQTLSRSLGVMATPSFLIGGQPIQGAQPTAVFEETFESALAAAK